MADSYLDQNAVLALGRKARNPDFRKKLDSALQSASVAVVVSSWHLIETAHTTNLANAVELAEFIDSLKPGWLLERHDIQKLDVEDDFCRFLRLDIPSRPRITTRSTVIAAVSGQKDSPRFDIPSRNFVRQWIEHPEQLKQLDRTYAFNTDSLIRLRQLVREGKVTEELRRRVNEIMVSAALPKATPGGIEVGPALNAEYLRQVQIQAIPTLAIETAISEQEWIVKDGSGVDRNTLIDKFHLISALPYVDEIVTDDAFFRKVYPSAEKTGHVKAKLVKNQEFLKRF
jgi:hypothetical protein